MRNVSGLSLGGNSSNLNTLFVTPAKLPSANTSTHTMVGRPRKKQKVQEEFSFTNFAAEESTRTRAKGKKELHLDVAMSEEWNQKAKEYFDLVYILFPKSQKPNSESVANAMDFLSTTLVTFKKSRNRKAAYPFALPSGTTEVKLELRTFFDDEACGSTIPA
jgi:hypothetical protein